MFLSGNHSAVDGNSTSSRKEAGEEEDDKKSSEKDNYEVLLSSLKVRLQNNVVINKNVVLDGLEDEGKEEGCKTPTSPEYKLPVASPACPPAPTKPKTMPGRRRGGYIRHKRGFLDFSSAETDPLFPPPILEMETVKKIRES
ncbi:unnamed protein product [Cuscuta europaea]|uniref:Uncharacterized protein n=1 Tax=Cuscuta europaea TaxID=41803 RepID=A0A9P1E266_CUSEU|nr:unnamed protein product [Cuscuta europaea]